MVLMPNYKTINPKTLKHRVIALLERKELEFLDKLGKDSLFSTGHKLSYNKIIEALIGFAMEMKINAENVSSAEALKQKLLALTHKKITEEVGNKENYCQNPTVPVERRKFIRIASKVKLGYRKLESLEPLKAVKTENISEQGIMVVLPEFFAPQTRLELSINTKDNEDPILAFGRVIWARQDEAKKGYVTGIQLHYINNKEKFYCHLNELKEDFNCMDNKEVKKGGA